MVKYACAFSQLELGKYFEWIIKTFKGSKENDVPENEYVVYSVHQAIVLNISYWSDW